MGALIRSKNAIFNGVQEKDIISGDGIEKSALRATVCHHNANG